MESQSRDGTSRPALATAELQRFEARLLEERKVAVAQLRQMTDQLGVSQTEADGELNTWKFHMADEGTDTYDREQASLTASREGRLLWHIDEALRRLYRAPETFGVCEECGSRIGADRLDALPYATRCVNCKQDWESGRAD